MRIDLFCRVIDNYGDIGVCWRLARQLVAEHGAEVRLIVDDLNAFCVVAPDIDPALHQQLLLGVAVVAWRTESNLVPSEVVIEAFACDPPTRYIDAMAAQTPKPVWINLEYLSAEAWVDEIHGLPSQHPRLSLTKYFFCPGFTELSGGLIRERWSAPTVIRSAGPGPIKVLAFAYPQAPVLAVADAFAAAGIESQITLAAPLAQFRRSWQTISPVAQTEFDALLSRFDFLIVRGEDSFVRAQWAGKPFLWHIYPTADGAHLRKLDAWLERYCVGLDANASAAYRAASKAFNSAQAGTAPGACYEQLTQNLGALAAHAVQWRATMTQQNDLASRLLQFVDAHKGKNLS